MLLGNDGASANEVMKSATEAWANIARQERVTGNVQGKFQYRRVATIGGELKKDETYMVEWGSNRKGMYLKRSAGDDIRLVAFNPDYLFDATRTSGESGYLLGNLRRGEGNRRVEVAVRDSWEPFLFSGFEIVNAKLPDLVADPGFKLLSFDRDEAQKTATMVFEFARDGSAVETSLTGGLIVLDTGRNWAISRYECPTMWGRMEGEVRYSQSESDAVPEVCRRVMYGSADDSVIEEVFELKELRPLAADEAVPVSLADYGLSAPSVEVAQGSHLGRWMLLLNGVLLCLAIAFIQYRRRRSAALS
jgi:hypothetical protein